MNREWRGVGLERLAKTAAIEVDTSEAGRQGASRDFGNIQKGSSVGVVRPRNTGEVARVVAFACSERLPLTVRGGGLSQAGQSLGEGSLTLDVCGLKYLGDPDPGSMTIRCGAGVTWRELFRHLSSARLAPLVLPLNLDLTIGGSLSAGCFGSTSHRYGAGASNVLAVEFVSGTGEVLKCNREQRLELQNVVLGGQGQYGALSQVELPLRRLPEKVRTFSLLYRDVQRFLNDQRTLATADRADHLEGLCAATMLGLRKGPLPRRTALTRWSYALQVSHEHAGDARAPEEALRGLSPDEVVHVEDNDLDEFMARYDTRFEFMRAVNAWQQPHPWLECVLPWDAAAEVIPRVLEGLPPFLGDGHRLTWVADRPRPSSLAFPSEGPFVCFGILPPMVPAALFEPALSALKAVDDALLACGGKRYLSGWIFRRRAADFRAHFGEAAHAELSRAKAALDPERIFTSTLFPSF